MTISRHLLLQARKSGHSGGGVAAAVETFERYHTVDLADSTNYVPADEGLFSASCESEDLSALLQDGGAVWRSAICNAYGNNATIGDGTNLAFWQNAGAARELVVMRHHISTGTYEQYHTADIAAGANYVPGDEGLFSHGSEDNEVECEYKYNAAWWKWATCDQGGVEIGTEVAIGDGSRLRYLNTNGGSARWVVIMRFVAGTGVETFERYHVEDLVQNGTYTPADDGLYSASCEGISFLVEVQNGGSWSRYPEYAVYGNDALIGDGTNMQFKQIAAGARNLVVMRHHISTGTYERYHTVDLAGGANYVPGDEGLFSHGSEMFNDNLCEYKYNANWWKWMNNSSGGGQYGTSLGIGDGSRIRYRNQDVQARWLVLLRHIMAT